MQKRKCVLGAVWVRQQGETPGGEWEPLLTKRIYRWSQDSATSPTELTDTELSFLVREPRAML